MLRKRLTDVLVGWGRINHAMIAEAVTVHRQLGRRIGEVLVELGFVQRWDVVSALAAQAGLNPVDLSHVAASPDAVACVPRAMAERYQIVPLRLGGRAGEALAIGIAAPVSLEAVDAIRAVSRKKVVPFVADERLIPSAIFAAYRNQPPRRGITILAEGKPDDEVELVTAPLAECLGGV